MNPETPNQCALRLGASQFRAELPAAWDVHIVLPVTPAPSRPAHEIFARALENPIASPRLRELARGKRSAAVLVPGKDRVAGASVFLPLVLDELNAGGIPDHAIAISLATGTHARHSKEEATLLLGEEALRRVEYREHDAQDEAALEKVGETPYGTEVFLDRWVLRADVKVLTGRIIPHYFAGFGGGRKALVPGVAGFRTILQNHRLTLAPRSGIHPGVRPCALEGNPVHEDMLAAARMVPDTFVLNALLDANHNVIAAVAGELHEAHMRGCDEARKMFSISFAAQYDAVITSCGGAPYDCNFMQSLKAAFNVQELLKPGGAMLWIGACPQGIHEGFLRWARVHDDMELERAVRARYDLTGHNAIMLRRLLRTARVAFWSDLPETTVRALGMQPVKSLAEGTKWLAEAVPGPARCAVIPHGNITHAALEGQQAGAL